MLLTIDVGNTNTKLAIFDGSVLRGAWRAATASTSRSAPTSSGWSISALMPRSTAGSPTTSGCVLK